MKSVLLIIPYFGKLPEWIDLFLLSCSYNQQFNWLLVTDDVAIRSPYRNVAIRHQTFQDYKRIASERINLDVTSIDPYKLCDLRPFFGIIHSDDIKRFDYWGYTDLDLIYGNLARFYTAEILNRYTIFSTHPDRMSGHFSLIANNPFFNSLALRIPNWRSKLLEKKSMFVDEWDFSHLTFAMIRRFRGHIGKKFMRLAAKLNHNPFLSGGVYAKEMYTTPLIPLVWHDGTLNWDQPVDWVWKSGRMFSERDDYEVPYMHFMNFKSSKYLVTGNAPWTTMQQVVHRGVESELTKTIRIDLAGIHTS